VVLPPGGPAARWSYADRVSRSLAVKAGVPATPSPGTRPRRIVLANLVLQSAIVLTGGLVRLTGSGLGCTTWPECVPGSYTPVAHQPQGWHTYVEFGNRLATGALIAVGTATFVLVRRHLRETGTRSPMLMRLAAAPLLGVVAQVVIGGVTVLSGLRPGLVAAHFLLSMVLVAAATALVLLLRPAAPGHRPDHPEIRLLVRAMVISSAIVLVLGTVVTGSGPHSGDAEHPARFGFDPRTVSWLHADAVLLFTGLVAALTIALRLVEAPLRAQKSAVQLLGVIVLQGFIGYLQYAIGLPIGVVVLHLLGTVLVTAGTTALAVETLRRRPDGAPGGE
jgi:cytochrome c oxidase assembly protein subunit 15